MSTEPNPKQRSPLDAAIELFCTVSLVTMMVCTIGFVLLLVTNSAPAGRLTLNWDSPVAVAKGSK